MFLARTKSGQVRSGEKRTLIVVALTAVMMVIEIAAGLIYGSMALPFSCDWRLDDLPRNISGAIVQSDQWNCGPANIE